MQYWYLRQHRAEHWGRKALFRRIYQVRCWKDMHQQENDSIFPSNVRHLGTIFAASNVEYQDPPHECLLPSFLFLFRVNKNNNRHLLLSCSVVLCLNLSSWRFHSLYSTEDVPGWQVAARKVGAERSAGAVKNLWVQSWLCWVRCQIDEPQKKWSFNTPQNDPFSVICVFSMFHGGN